MQSPDSIRIMRESITALQNTLNHDYAGLFIGLQDRCTAVENELKLGQHQIYSMQAGYTNLKSQVDGIELGTKVEDKIAELEIQSRRILDMIKGGSPTMNADGFNLQRPDAINALGTFDKKDEKMPFDRYMSNIKSQIDQVPEYDGVLKWAREQGQSPIDISDLTPVQKEIGAKIWSLFM